MFSSGPLLVDAAIAPSESLIRASVTHASSPPRVDAAGLHLLPEIFDRVRLMESSNGTLLAFNVAMSLSSHLRRPRCQLVILVTQFLSAFISLSLTATNNHARILITRLQGHILT